MVSTATPRFPPSLWKAVLLDQYVNLNLISTSKYTSVHDAPRELLLGDSDSLQLSKPKTVTKITTEAQWLSAWVTYARAVNFAFNGRKEELNSYREHIENAFASRDVSMHPLVLEYDRAARIAIGETRSLLFDDVATLQELRDAVLLPGGTVLMQHQ
ncbi:hypothetical protein C8F01DRAFT_1302606, partial [Mycena amicta]